MKKSQLFGTVASVAIATGYLLSGNAIAQGCFASDYSKFRENNITENLSNPFLNLSNPSISNFNEWLESREATFTIATLILGYLSGSWLLRRRSANDSKASDEPVAEAVEEAAVEEVVVEETVQEKPSEVETDETPEETEAQAEATEEEAAEKELVSAG